MQKLLALERVVDPLRASVQIRCGTRDDRRGAEHRGHVVEQRVGSLRCLSRLPWHQRLVALSQRALERVEQLCELEAQKALGIEERDPVLTLESGQHPDRVAPQVVQARVRMIDVLDHVSQANPERALRIDAEVL